MRRLQLPRCSFREHAHPADMAGAIFMSNSETREDCFGAGVFGLPPEYAPFVANVRQGMPLFLFDYTERKLYGVFEATSNGGMDIRRGAFRSAGRTYPAQVCFNIVWKCRPLSEDEFFPAIEDNYYISKKFYFDLSYQQVVNLYGLFDKKRVQHPISNYSTRAYLEKEHSGRGSQDKRSLSPNTTPLSADQSHSLILSSSAAGTNCSASTSMHPSVPHSFEAQPNVSMPLVTKPFGVQTAPIYSNQLKLPYHTHEDLRDVSAITQVAAPFSQTLAYHGDRFLPNQSYPLSHDYLQNRLSSGCSTQVPTDGVRLSVNQSYEGSSSLYSRYSTQVPTGDDRSYLTPYVPLYPHLSLASPQHNANLRDDYDNCEQCKAIYASEHKHLKSGKCLTPLELTQQGTPAYPEAPEVSAISQQKECSTGYIPIPDCAEDFEMEQPRRDFSRDVSGSSGSGNDTGAYISDQPFTNHDVGAESNMTVPSQRPQKTVFSRLSMKPQQPSQEIPGPSLNQLLYSLSKRTEQWGSTNRSPTKYVSNRWVREQDNERPYPSAELNLPIGLEQEEESADPPFLNFKRRSKAAGLDTNAASEVSDKPKRRKLVRPSFGQSDNTASSGKDVQENALAETETVRNKLQENAIVETETDRNNTASSGKDVQENALAETETVRNKLQENAIVETETDRNKLQKNALVETETVRNKLQENVIMEMTRTPVENVIMERNHSPVETDGNEFFIDLNEPAFVDCDLVEGGSIVPSPDVVVKTQTDKPCVVDMKKPSCLNSNEVISKQDRSSESGAPSEKITLDLNVTDLNTMDDAKLKAILDSSLLQALDKLRNGKSNDSDKAKSGLCGKNSVVKMETKSEPSTNRRCN